MGSGQSSLIVLYRFGERDLTIDLPGDYWVVWGLYAPFLE